MESWRHQYGLSLLEFTLAALIVAVLALLAFDRIAAVRGDMERARVQHTVAAMRGALALRFADLVVNDRLNQLDRHDDANALELLAPPPAGYSGERARAAAQAEPGSWYYVRDTGVVAYRPRYPLAFEGAGEHIYWSVVTRRDSNGDAGYDGAARGDAIALVRSTADGRPLSGQNEPETYEQQAESQP